MKHADEKRNKEDIVIDSKDIFYNVCKDSAIGLYRTTPDGRILFASPELIKMLGYGSFEELKQINLQNSDFEKLGRKEFKLMLEKQGEVRGFKSRWQRKDGSFLNVRESARVICDEHGAPVYYDGIVEDITEIEITDEENKSQKQSMKSLSAVAMKFIELPFETDIYTFLAEELYDFIGRGAYVIVNSVDPLRGFLTNKAIAGLSGGYRKLIKLMGKDVSSIRFYNYKKELDYLRDGKLHKDERTLYQILQKSIPENVCTLLERVYSIGKIYTMGLVKEQDLFGTVIIILRKNYTLTVNEDSVENFVKLAAIAVQRRNAEERTRHLNLVLSAIRNVNQLIASEKDKKRLIERACDLLTETRGYSSAWIALFNKNRQINISAQSGLGRKFKEVRKLLNSDSIECCRRAEETDSLVFIKNTHEECKGCPLLGMEPTERTFTIKLKHENRSYGYFSISINQDLSVDVEEQELFMELADDISFALYRIDLEQENRAALEKLRLSEDRLSKILKAANDGYWDWNLKTNEVYFDPRYYEMAGYKVNEFPGNLEEFTKRVHRDDVDNVRNNIEKHLRGETERYEVEFRIKAKSGRWMWILSRGMIVEYDEHGKPERFIGTHTDITDRKRVEYELKLSEEKFKILFEYAPDGYYINDMKGRFVEGNRAAEQIVGYSKDELIGKNIFNLNLVQKKHLPRISKLLMEAALGNKFSNEEFTLIRKDGKHINIEISGYPIKIHGEKFVLGTLRDITEIKKAEKALRESEVKYRTIFETSSDAMFVMYNDIFTDCNEATLKMFKCSRNDIVGSTPYKFSPRVQPDGRDSKNAALEYINGALGGNPQFFEWLHCTLDGEEFPAEVSLNNFKVGKDTFIMARVRDITERKRTEETLHRWANIFKNTGLGIVIGGVDKEKTMELMNPAFAEMHGYSMDELQGESIARIFPEDELGKVLENIKIAHKKGHHVFEADHMRRDGTRFPSLIDVTAVKDKNGKILYRIVNVNDITEKKKVEDALKKSLKEKDVLIREIHHRVKNNLQIIHSLISMQQRGLKDKNAIENFEETKSRVLVMARVHELLYGSDNLAEINFRKYLESMAKELVSGSDIANKVNLKYDIQEVFLHIEIAVPCGLIVNELITNSLKYAFQNFKKGEIFIKFYKSGNNAELTVEDNGTGLPDYVDLKNPTGFGLKLVSILTEQLDGTVQVNKNKGTKFIITFPLEES